MRADEALQFPGSGKKFEVESVKNPGGGIMIDGQHVADTLQCCHCGRHWVPIKGSGRVRGWCTRCHHVTCGNSECMECVPYEQKIAQMEKKASSVIITEPLIIRP